MNRGWLSNFGVLLLFVFSTGCASSSISPNGASDPSRAPDGQSRGKSFTSARDRNERSASFQGVAEENSRSFVEKPYPGVYIIKNSKDEFEIAFVEEKSPAGRAHLQIGDVIESVDNLRFKDRRSLFEYLYERKKPGEIVNALLRRGGETIRVDVKLGLKPFLYDQYVLSREVTEEKPIRLAIIFGEITNVYLQDKALLEQWQAGMKSALIRNWESTYLQNLRYENNFSLVDRNKIDQILKELPSQQTRFAQEGSPMKLGSMLGATHLFIIDFSRFTLSPREANDVETHRLIEFESGKTIASLSLKTRVKLEFELAAFRHDLTNYQSAIKEISPLEVGAIEAYANVTGANFRDDFTLKTVLISKVIPTYTDFLARLGRIVPQTIELKNIHQNYIEGANLQLEAFEIMIKGIEKEDRSLIETANEKLNQGKNKMRQWREEMAAISRE
jgi:hypothetical protein